MAQSGTGETSAPHVFITGELDRRPAPPSNHMAELGAVQELARRMASDPKAVLPRFVDLAMDMTGGVSAGLSLFEEGPGAGVFRWKHLRGVLATFEGALTPRDFSPCGVTLDEGHPVLARHPEQHYDWIAEAGIVVPEVLLAPLYVGSEAPFGTLWIVSDGEAHFHRGHAQAVAEVAGFVGLALRMMAAEQELEASLERQSLLAREMDHRLKNLFSVADAVIRFGARNAGSVEDLAEALRGRLHALASAHALVSRNPPVAPDTPRTSDLKCLLEAVTAPHQSGGRISVKGPPATCGEHAINALALVFHELATNAAKYGALSTPEGEISIVWRMEEANLRILWREVGGPAAPPPSSSGFGGALIRKTVDQFGGTIGYDWSGQGLVVELALPLRRLTL